MESPTRSPSRAKGHARTRSAGVLKSIVKPASRVGSPKKRAAFAGDEPEGGVNQRLKLFSSNEQQSPAPQVLGEVQNGAAPGSPQRTNRGHQKTQSLVFWNDSSFAGHQLSPPPKKLFKEKENTTPPSASGWSPPPVTDVQSPIWAQFTSRPDQELSRLRDQRLGTKTNTQEEIEKYAPPAFNAAQPRATSRPVSHAFDKELPSAPLDIPTSPSKKADTLTRQNSAPNVTLDASPRKSKVMAAIAKLQGVSTDAHKETSSSVLSGQDLNDAFEQVLISRNIPEHRRHNMRTLDEKIKREFIRNHKPGPANEQNGQLPSPKKGLFSALKSSKEDLHPRGRRSTDDKTDDECDSPTKRNGSRNGAFSWGKRSRSGSRTRGLMSLKNLSSSSLHSLSGHSKKEQQDDLKAQGPRSTPDEFVVYLQSQHQPEKIEVGRLHKLRLLLRNEAIEWVDSFIELGGMTALIELLNKIMTVEWREEHEDLLLHEVLLCMKGLCTSQNAMNRLDDVSGALFPKLIDMIFDEERKGPSEFNTRGVITTLVFEHLAAAGPSQRLSRAQEALLYLADRKPTDDKRPATFITQMQQNRPYQAWCRELSSVTKEAFWIFLHHLNVIHPATVDQDKVNESYFERHFPKERPPIPAQPYMGGVEWDATNYMATHLDLMNGIIASLPTTEDRNALRDELKASGMEKVMGDKLRLCKSKFYSCVHDGLRTWVAAAQEDGWETHDVSWGPPKKAPSPRKNDVVKNSQAPQLDLPKLDVGGPKTPGGEGWI